MCGEKLQDNVNYTKVQSARGKFCTRYRILTVNKKGVSDPASSLLLSFFL